mgnify:CR=1 FL=1
MNPRQKALNVRSQMRRIWLNSQKPIFRSCWERRSPFPGSRFRVLSTGSIEQQNAPNPGAFLIRYSHICETFLLSGSSISCLLFSPLSNFLSAMAAKLAVFKQLKSTVSAETQFLDIVGCRTSIISGILHRGLYGVIFHIIGIFFFAFSFCGCFDYIISWRGFEYPNSILILNEFFRTMLSCIFLAFFAMIRREPILFILNNNVRIVCIVHCAPVF